jgi:drug/metabolite transporter (DMT)-like permease
MREAVGLRRWIAVAIGFLGVLVILRPGSDAFSVLALIPVAAALLRRMLHHYPAAA